MAHPHNFASPPYLLLEVGDHKIQAGAACDGVFLVTFRKWFNWFKSCDGFTRAQVGTDSMMTVSTCRFSDNEGQQAKNKEEDEEAGTPEMKIENT